MPNVSRRYTHCAPAKINLFLDVQERRADGYHTLETVMRPVALCDEIAIARRADGAITIACDAPGVPADASNLAVRAALTLREAFADRIDAADRAAGWHIEIAKRIPTGAGLGGGSADAAATLRLLRAALHLDASDGELAAVGAQIGSDVPFMVIGRTMIARGRGEILEEIECAWERVRLEGGATNVGAIVLVCPAAAVATADAYRWWDEAGGPRTCGTAREMVDALRAGDWGRIVAACENGFQRVVEARVPEVAHARAALEAAGCAKAVLSGSGAAVFGLAESLAEAESIAETLEWQFPLCVALAF